VSVLDASGLTKRFGGVVATRAVSLRVAVGELVAVIGPNGAGKSTLFAMIGGQLRPDAGRVRFAGTDVTDLAPHARARRGLARTHQIAATFGSMSVVENVQVAVMGLKGQYLGFLRSARRRFRNEAEAVLERLELGRHAARPCAELAYGELKRVELALALAGKPRLLVMDEPTAGMTPAERDQVMAGVARLARAQELAVLYTEHDMDAVFGHADRVLVLDRGAVIAHGTPGMIGADPRVQEVYLGRPAPAVAEDAP
jgi:branched-chain amino acid transport system ATP-binding protein